MPDQQNRPKLWEPAIITAAVAALAAVTVGLSTAIVSYKAARYGFDAKMVELGVNILATDPGKSDVVPAREWAIGLVETHSGRAFKAEDRAKLMHEPLIKCMFWSDVP